MTNRLFAYNPGGGGIIGVDILGELAMSNSERDYGADYAGLKWWGGPDEDLGYVIAKTVPPNNQPTEVPGLTGDVAFNRSSVKTEESFLDIVRIAFGQTFGTGDDAKTWLNNNGYWTSWGLGAPSATPTPTPTPGPTSTPTLTPTPTPTPSGATTIDLGSINCRIVGSCNDNGLCGVRYNINFANGRPSATQVYIELFGSNTASLSIHNDLGNNTDVYLDYSETSGFEIANFRLVLKSFPSGTEICRSGDLTLSHNYNGQPWNMVGTC